MSAQHAPHDALSRFPIAALAAPLGLSGLATAWARVSEIAPSFPDLGLMFTVLAAFAWLIGGLGLGAKALLRPTAMAGDLKDPMRLALLAAGAIALMNLGGQVAPMALGPGLWLWRIGALALTAISWVFLARLLDGRLPFAAAHPTWLMPMVGPIAAPTAGMALGQDLVAHLMFGQGLFGLALILPALIVRQGFHDRPPEGPALVIFMTPPALGSVALAALVGAGDMVTHFALGAGFAIAIALIANFPKLIRHGLNLAAWSALFPTANLAIGTLLVGPASDAPWLTLMGMVLTILASLYGLALALWSVTRGLTAGFTAQGLVRYET